MSSYPSNTSDTREAGKASEASDTREAGKASEASEAGGNKRGRARGSNTGLAYYCPVHRIIECPCVRSHVYS